MSPRLRSLAGSALLIAFFAVWFVGFRPVALGGSMTWVVIRGSSMLPTFDTGDIVVVRTVPAYEVGDVVAYRVPEDEFGAGHVVIHRLVGGDTAAGFVAQGDNNDSIDPWMPRGSDIVGRQWLIVPGLGRVITFIAQPAIAGGLAAALMVAYVIARSDQRKTRLATPTVVGAPGGCLTSPDWTSQETRETSADRLRVNPARRIVARTGLGRKRLTALG